MEDLTKPFFRPRKQSLSAIIERIVLEKQRQKEKAIFEQQPPPPAQQPVTVTKVEPLELIDDSANDSRSVQSQGDFPALGLNLSQDGDSSMPDMSQLAPRAPHHSSVVIHHSSASFVSQEEDEEMDDDDSTEKEDANIDPERLKAFNLFVRLNVDEHLDRTVPISKQPKERIQTIIDSCSRQFPEFEDRARKRLRTYLKACRRHKKLREPLTVSEVGSLGRLSRAASGQLGSAQAEAILAQACHNETRGSKRRLSTTDDAETSGGHQDGQQTPLMQVSSMIPPESSSTEAPSVSCVPAPAPVPAPVSSLASYLSMASHLAPAPASTLAATPMPAPGPGPTPAATERAFYPDPSVASVLNHQLNQQMNLQPPTSAFYHVDVNQLLRHVLPSRAGGPPPSHGAGGDLYFRRAAQTPLSFSEAVAVRALADGYRQSASLLRRTADELESLIPHNMP